MDKITFGKYEADPRDVVITRIIPVKNKELLTFEQENSHFPTREKGQILVSVTRDYRESGFLKITRIMRGRYRVNHV